MTTPQYVEKDVQVGDLSLHYQEWGSEDAPPVVMLHGFALSGHMYDEFADRMRGTHRLLSLDQRGHGDSDWAEDGNYTREAFAADVDGFADALGLERFVLIGHSMGGLNAAYYAATHPERVKALVLVDVGPEAAREGVESIVQFTRMPAEVDFDEYVRRAHQFNPRRTEENIRERMRHRLKPTGNGLYTWKFDSRFRDSESGVRVGSSSSNDDTWDVFRRIQMPVLLVRGEESDILTQDVAERTIREMVNARLAVVKQAGHSVPGDNPDEFTQVVSAFLHDAANGNATAEPEHDPLPTAVMHQVRASQRRSGLMALVLAGAGLAVGASVMAWVLRSRRQKSARRRTIEALPVSRQDVDAARGRALALASDLSRVGQERAAELRSRAADPDVRRATRQHALDLVESLERQIASLDETTRDRLRAAQQRRKRQRLLRLRRQPDILEQTLGGAANALDQVASLKQRRGRKAQEQMDA